MKKYKKENCSPKGKEKLDFTCYTSEGLVKLKEIWNARHPDSMITSNEPRKIWEQLKVKMGKTCDRESCWLKHQCIKENVDKALLDYTFAPDTPEEWKKKPFEWLSSIEISQVMKQYEHVYKCFEFLGPSPIDFDKHKLYGECVWEELCKFNLLETIKRGKSKIGIIFNIDPHYKEGSHWVAMFIDMTHPLHYIDYFDSAGDKPPQLIHKFMKSIKTKFDKNKDDSVLIYNDRRHQYGTSECGVYSIYYILSRIENKTPFELSKKHITDAQMNKLRDYYFRR